MPMLEQGGNGIIDGNAARINQLEAELQSLRGGQLNPLAACPHGYREGVHSVVAAGKWSCDVPPVPLKLDLGCGTTVRRNITGFTKEKGWTGVDLSAADGVDVACDLGKDRWPWPDSSVDEINCAHMAEHLSVKDIDYALVDGKLIKTVTCPRAHFFNEMWRVLKPGAKALMTTPHWCSNRAFGDVTHEWPPVSEMFWLYLDKPWRDQNAPHAPFTCDFQLPATYGYLFAPWLIAEIQNRNDQFVQQKVNEALQRYKEAAQDMQCTLTARK